MKRINGRHPASRGSAAAPQKPYWEMNTEELAEATREFDRENLSPGKPLRGEMLARYERARRKRGRPIVGDGSRAISVTIETGLLARADRVARARHISRSQLIAQALLAELRAERPAKKRSA